LITTLGRWINRCDIHYRAQIEPGVLFPHGLGVVIGEGVVIKSKCSIFQNCSLGTSEGKEGAPVLEEGVNLYPGTVVAGPLTIGEYARIGPNVYLTGSVQNHTRVLPAQNFVKPQSP
jgi:serine O-acetyltransferase